MIDSQSLDYLVRRANRAGHASIPDYTMALVKALSTIADANAGVWSRVARDALDGKEAT